MTGANPICITGRFWGEGGYAETIGEGMTLHYAKQLEQAVAKDSAPLYVIPGSNVNSEPTPLFDNRIVAANTLTNIQRGIFMDGAAADLMIERAFGWDPIPTNVIVLVHGFNTRAQTAIACATSLWENMCTMLGGADNDIGLVSYDWPSSYSIDSADPAATDVWARIRKVATDLAALFNTTTLMSFVQNYLRDGETVAATKPAVDTIIGLLVSSTKVQSVHVLGHSMGGRVVLQSIADFARMYPTTADTPLAKLKSCILKQADVDSGVGIDALAAVHGLHDRIGRHDICTAHIFSHAADHVLEFSQQIHGPLPRVGLYTEETVLPVLQACDRATRLSAAVLLFGKYSGSPTSATVNPCPDEMLLRKLMADDNDPNWLDDLNVIPVDDQARWATWLLEVYAKVINTTTDDVAIRGALHSATAYVAQVGGDRSAKTLNGHAYFNSPGFAAAIAAIVVTASNSTPRITTPRQLGLWLWGTGAASWYRAASNNSTQVAPAQGAAGAEAVRPFPGHRSFGDVMMTQLAQMLKKWFPPSF